MEIGDSMVQKLKALIEEANQALSTGEGCHTESDRKALKDMVIRAGKALSGETVPFSRNREFLSPREQEEMEFAYDRYTMVPSFFEKGRAHGHYGLREALDWYRSRDMDTWTEEMLRNAKQEVEKKGWHCLETAAYGEGVGAYDEQCGQRLRRALWKLEETRREDYAADLSECMDALEAFRHSRKLASEVMPGRRFLLTEEKVEQLRDSIRKDTFARKQYDRIKAIARETNLADSKMLYEQIWDRYGYEELNRHFRIWGDSGRMVNIMTPPGTKSARLSFRLPGRDNEQEGLGHIWVTGIRLSSADEAVMTIPDNSFQGVEKEKAPTGEVCLCLRNRTPEEEAVAVCSEILPLEGNRGYTLFFQAKQDGKLKEGLQARLDFLDGDGAVLDSFVHVHNRKSYVSIAGKALQMQCEAIVYALEGEREYARKAKYSMLIFLNDFCQGAEYWMVNNARPEGCDAYGAVQAGRILCSAAATYSLIEEADVFSAAEKQFFYDMVDYLLHYCLDMRDRTMMSQERVQEGSSNWQTDMCIGVAALLSVLPDYPDRKVWMYNAEAVLRAQLALNLNPDGSWPESIRYHHAALEHFATFAAVWKQETGEDWMETTRLKEMFRYAVHTITPGYEYFDGRIGTPSFGDHRLSGGEEFAIYGKYVEKMALLDKKTADEMYQVWQMAGYPVKELSGESLAVENLLYPEPETYKLDAGNLLRPESTAAYPDSGIYVFRGGSTPGKENYLAVMASGKPIGHGHLDQGSFILYYQNVPVVMDSGIEGYFDTSTQWHLYSLSHACLQFAATGEERRSMRREEQEINLNAGNYSLDRGWLDVPRMSKVKEVWTEGEEEGISVEIEHPCGSSKGVHHRIICFDRNSGIVTIKDSIKGYCGKVLFSLPLAMKDARAEGQRIVAEGFYSTGAEIEFLSPLAALRMERGRTTPMFPAGKEVPMLLYIRAEADAGQGVEVRIRPYKMKG